MEIKSNDEKVKVESNEWNLNKCSIHPDLQKMLIEQMSVELYNHNLYRSFANYYSVNGLNKLSDYYSMRAQEEYNHFLWCIKFANESDLRYDLPKIDEVNEKLDNFITPFEIALDAEIETTEMIYDMADRAREVKDNIFLQWLYKSGLLVDEQSEECSLSRKTLAIMNLDDSILAKQDAIANLYGN